MLLLHWQTIFPIWDKTQCIPQKEESQSGSLSLPLCFNWEIPWCCAFIFSSFLWSSTKQHITLNQIEDLKEILCSSRIKFRLLAGPEILWRLKGNFLWKLSILVYLHVIRWWEIWSSSNIRWLAHAQKSRSAVTWPSLGCSLRGWHFFYTVQNDYNSVGC